jgi:hypothetical protein
LRPLFEDITANQLKEIYSRTRCTFVTCAIGLFHKIYAAKFVKAATFDGTGEAPRAEPNPRISDRVTALKQRTTS